MMFFKEWRWHRSLKKGDLETVSRLFSSGMDLNQFIEGGTPLEIASKYGHPSLLELLLKNGAKQNIYVMFYYDQCNVLHLPIIHNNINLIDPILKYSKKIDPKIKSSNEDINGLTPLLLSLYKMKDLTTKNKGDYEAIAFKLIDLGADIKLADNQGKTAFHYATNANSINLLDKMLGLGFEINKEDNFGRTAIYYSIDLDLLKFLMDNKIDINHQDKQGFTPLSYCEDGNKFLPFSIYDEKIKLLKEFGAR